MGELKHLDDQPKAGDEMVEFDVEEAATGAILKAIADYQGGMALNRVLRF